MYGESYCTELREFFLFLYSLKNVFNRRGTIFFYIEKEERKKA